MRLLLISAILILTAGCAHKLPMAVDSSSKSLDLGEKSLLLLTMDISRQEESRYQPVPRFLRVGEVDGEGKITTLKVLPLDDDGTLSVNGGKTLYVFRVAVAEGKQAFQACMDKRELSRSSASSTSRSEWRYPSASPRPSIWAASRRCCAPVPTMSIGPVP